MRWGEDTIQRVKEANEVVGYISQTLPLKKSGSSYKALCPFHQEKTPSFTVNPAKQIFHCFGCDLGGDIIRFVMLYDGMPFVEAVEKLAHRGGVDLPKTDAADPKERSLKDSIFKANRIAADFYNTHLMKGDPGKHARDYLADRGIHSDVCKIFGIGFAPDGWRSLAGVLKNEGIPRDVAVRSGLLISSEGKEPYDRFRGRIVFPIRDLSGRVQGFGGRVLDESLPKYVNTPETEVYHKGASLYGLDVAASYVREADEVLLVEGYLDVITLHQGGFGNVVGVLGTALTSHQAKKIRRLSVNCILLFDADNAGRKAALRSGQILLDEGMECRVALLEPGEDPDSYLRSKGAQKLGEEVSHAPNLIKFVLDEAKERLNHETIAGRLKVLDAIVPYLAKIKDRATLGAYLKEVGDELKIEQEDLRSRLIPRKNRHDRISIEDEKASRKIPRGEELLAHIMTRDPSVVPRIKELILPEDLSSPEIASMMEDMFAGATFDSLINDVSDHMKDLLSKWALEDPVEGMDRALEDCLQWFANRKLERRIQEAKEKLQQAEAKGDEEEFKELTKRWQNLIGQKREREKSMLSGSSDEPAWTSGGDPEE